MRVLAEEGVLLALGTVLAVMTGIRTDAVFIAGLLLAVSVTGLVEWLHADERWPWLPCVAYLIVAAAVPAWCSFMPLIAYDMARLAAAGRPSQLVTAVRWLWVLPFAALWFVRVSHAGVAAGAADANSPYAGAGSYVDRVARIRRGTVPPGFGWESTCAVARSGHGP